MSIMEMHRVPRHASISKQTFPHLDIQLFLFSLSISLVTSAVSKPPFPNKDCKLSDLCDLSQVSEQWRSDHSQSLQSPVAGVKHVTCSNFQQCSGDFLLLFADREPKAQRGQGQLCCCPSASVRNLLQGPQDAHVFCINGAVFTCPLCKWCRVYMWPVNPSAYFPSDLDHVTNM